MNVDNVVFIQTSTIFIHIRIDNYMPTCPRGLDRSLFPSLERTFWVRMPGVAECFKYLFKLVEFLFTLELTHAWIVDNVVFIQNY